MLKSLFNKFSGLQAGNFITKMQQHRCFSVNIAISLKASILTDICGQPLLNFQSGGKNRKNRYVSRDDNRRRIQNPPSETSKMKLFAKTVAYI